MTVSKQILSFYQSLRTPKGLPASVKVMNPYQDEIAWPVTQAFYEKYYSKGEKRVVLFGINPGRFGGGITGVPFTDPMILEKECEINNPFEKRGELSSKFIYEMINAYGGPSLFYQHFYISALSPLGYVGNDKNLNYYDIPKWKSVFEDYAAKTIQKQLPFIRTDVAFSIGKGENYKFLKYINDRFSFFESIEFVPHPRWVMQYRLKRKEEFIDEYIDKLSSKMR